MKKNNWKYILIILVISIMVMLPKILGNYQINDDTEFHITNTLATLETLDDFIPDDILPDIAGNYGYATRQFYPVLAHTTTAYIMKLTGLSVTNTFKFVQTLILFLSGVTMYFLALRYSKKESLALTSALIYMLMPYHLTDIYIRDALAECFFFMFPPMILTGLTYLFEDKKKFLILFSLGYVGGMLSHLTMMIYFTLLLIPFFIINYKKVFKKETLLTLITGALIILGIMAPTIIMLVKNKLYGHYEVFVPGAMAQGIQHAGLWLDYINYFGVFKFLFNGSTAKYYLDIITIILMLMVIVKRKEIDFKKYKFIIWFGLISLFMSSIIFPWDLLPQSLRIIQFPWRLETFVGIALALIAPLSIPKIKISPIVIDVGMIALALLFNTSSPRSYLDLNNLNYERGMGWQLEYLPVNAYNNWENLKNSPYEIQTSKGNSEIISDRVVKLVFRVDNDTDIILPRLYYFGYYLRDSDSNLIPISESNEGLIKASVTKGEYILSYEQPKAVKLGNIVSLISIILLLCFIFVKKEKEQKAFHKLIKFLNKYREIIMYGIFGILTTIINIFIFYILDKIGINVYLNNSIAWLISVLFAFFTNKFYVFESKNNSVKVIFKEGISFFAARVLSYFIDMLTIFILFQTFGLNKMLSKVISNVIVIIINYVLSKLVIFKNK
jgi:putative flippase GtrA